MGRTPLVSAGVKRRSDETTASISSATPAGAASGHVPTTETMLATCSVAGT